MVKLGDKKERVNQEMDKKKGYIERQIKIKGTSLDWYGERIYWRWVRR